MKYFASSSYSSSVTLYCDRSIVYFRYRYLVLVLYSDVVVVLMYAMDKRIIVNLYAVCIQALSCVFDKIKDKKTSIGCKRLIRFNLCEICWTRRDQVYFYSFFEMFVVDKEIKLFLCGLSNTLRVYKFGI